MSQRRCATARPPPAPDCSVSSSRAILYAAPGADFADAARRATLALRDQINQQPPAAAMRLRAGARLALLAPARRPQCAAPAPPRAAGGDILVRGGGPDPDSLDPQKARGFEAQSILRDLCEGLTTLDHKAAVAPGVASRWSVSADGKTYTFMLRPEARWSNGERVGGGGFRRRAAAPGRSGHGLRVRAVRRHHRQRRATSSPAQEARRPLGVRAPDAATVVITLAAPAAYLPTLLSHPSTCPVHRPTLAAHPEGFARAGVMPANGAFVLQRMGAGLAHQRAAQPRTTGTTPPRVSRGEVPAHPG